MGMVLCKVMDQYLSSYQTWTKSIIGFGNNEVLKALMQNFNIYGRRMWTPGVVQQLFLNFAQVS